MKKIFRSEQDGSGVVPAAQYIRMSTEHQRYSPDNQRAAIAAYAAARGFGIVETYQDSGKSGLSLKGRAALQQLLSDVITGSAKFKAILVLDVSRWGRFQDTDQSAHYEFMCREAGVSVHYCSEPFENEGGTVASIVKHMKRVMAAEYSRELSEKIARAQRQQARLGFKQGGPPPFGLRRQVIDENGKPRMILKPGQRKAFATDSVVYIHGPRSEIVQVTGIFRAFVNDKMRLGAIATWLNKAGRTQTHGTPWTSNAVRNLLSNELYIGRYVFGKTSNNLGQPRLCADTDLVTVQVIEPIVPAELFEAAQIRLLQITRRQWSDDDIAVGLRRLFNERGRLSYRMIRACSYLPDPSTVRKRYGGMSGVYRSVGYAPPTRCRVNAHGAAFTDDDMLRELRRIHSKHGYLSAQVIEEDEAAPSPRYYIRRFGGLVAAFRLAGFDVSIRSQRYDAYKRRKYEGRRPPHRSNPDGTRITNAQLVEKLRDLLARHGYLSTKLINADETLPSASFFASRLGGLRAAYSAVGYLSTQSDITRAAIARADRVLDP